MHKNTRLRCEPSTSAWLVEASKEQLDNIFYPRAFSSQGGPKFNKRKRDLWLLFKTHIKAQILKMTTTRFNICSTLFFFSGHATTINGLDHSLMAQSLKTYVHVKITNESPRLAQSSHTRSHLLSVSGNTQKIRNNDRVVMGTIK